MDSDPFESGLDTAPLCSVLALSKIGGDMARIDGRVALVTNAEGATSKASDGLWIPDQNVPGYRGWG